MRGTNLQISVNPQASLVAQTVKNLPAMEETQAQSLSQEDPLEKGMAIYFSILAWRIPWPEEPGELQYTGSQRVGHNRVTNTHTHTHTYLLSICLPISPSYFSVISK